MFHSGFVAVLGRANVGKSSLVNKLTGQKVAIVSPKPQTTRNKLNGILTTADYQIVFEDTPGIHAPKSALAKYMQKSWESASEDTDIIVVVVDGTKGVLEGDLELLQKLSSRKCHLLVALNKTDLAKKEDILPSLARLGELGTIEEIVPLSARTGENVDVLLKKIVSLLPVGVKYYDEDDYTDQTTRFMAGEIIREKILLYFNQEIPHGVGIEIEKFSYDEERDITEIGAVIICEKAAHKPIIIGKGGLALKKIGATARHDIEQLIDGHVFLTLFVKVKEDWRESDFMLKELGYNKKDIHS